MKKALFYVVMFLFIQLVVTSAFSLGAKIAGMPKVPPVMYIVMFSVFNLIVIAVFAWLKWTPVNRKYMRSRPGSCQAGRRRSTRRCRPPPRRFRR